MKVIYPGTFDPPTKGHLHIIERASHLFDEVIVAIGIDPEKKTSLKLEQRLQFLETLTKGMPNVTVSSFEGLLGQFAKEHRAQGILRSLRTFQDYEREKTFAEMNKTMTGLETLFLFPEGPYQSISSSLVRDIAKKGEPIAPFVPEAIASEVAETLRAIFRSDHSQ
ncbi:MAG: pantetheine-phosphate adenylyltransferase [Chlamydiia bacterium]|nr:pantetheine-phosphate adenylyltransferase [Chlamydiia bacterium]